jgi:riboflavin synthase
MFTGIIKSVGQVSAIEKDGSNVHFTVESNISRKLKIDQSVSHNGVCLTVVEQSGMAHRVTAIDETIARTSLGGWKVGTLVNLERCLKMNARLDGHIVQGHVDCRAKCLKINELDGSWRVDFAFENTPDHVLVDKGSVTVNGISLTVVEPSYTRFSVAIIPYTWENTNFHQLCVGDFVNIEFDIIGKYVARLMARQLGET